MTAEDFQLCNAVFWSIVAISLRARRGEAPRAGFWELFSLGAAGMAYVLLLVGAYP